MILTEEQRAALKRVVAYMDEMYAIASPYYGCTEDANILRAMIDGSEHFTDATKMIGFDLERAREAIEEAVDRLSQKIGDEDGPIWEKEPEKAAVLQTLPDEIAHLEKWMIKNRDAATELQYQLDDAIKENERLRSAIKTYREREESAFSEIKMKDEFLMRQNARIKELEAEIERLREALDKSEQILAHKTKTSTHWYEEGLQTRADLVQCKRVVDQQAAKIKELEANCIYDPETGKVFVPDGHPELEKLRARNRDLEDALVEDLARDIAYDGGILWSVRRSKQDEYRKIARDQLRIEGKIGPDAKPHCWQITEERKAAIRGAEIALRDAVLDSNDPHCWDAETAVLRAMLTEAE